MCEVRFAQGVRQDLMKTRPFDRNRILDSIEEKLSRDPDRPTRNRRILVNLAPPFEAIPPVWELRVGEYRIFHDVDAESEEVFVRAVRRKPPGMTTEEIL